MSDAPSAELLDRYRRDDPAAAEELYGRYAERLIRLARARLSPALAARVDAEDVALSAWRSFFVLAREEELVLRESGDLWRLLARITVRKVCRSARRQRAGCRSVERERPYDEEILASGPSPADVAELADELRCVLAPLDTVRRRIAELRLQGHEAEEIAALVGRSARTVRRVLAWLGEELQRRLAGDPAPPDPSALIEYGEIMLQRQLGQGGMGKVYQARWRGEVVAVKLLPKPLRGHAPVAARFLEEAAVLGRLRHPGIVAVRGLGKLPDGGHFLVMDLVEGGDLARRLAAGPVAVRDALTWTAEVADAIENAHSQGVVHCDLKPSNLLLDRAGRVRVTDFGLARTLAGSARLAGGTPGFMAPEQSHPDGEVSPRTDVHGLGAVLYVLLSGRPPFAGGEPPSLTALRSDVPAEVGALCRRCLDPEPERRPASASDVAAEVRALLESCVPLR
jgi:tRNA A-37 threonylcarbamoyl transferase component Bud32/DNA-directed RNA polymerase specialized sigma24 family protein